MVVGRRIIVSHVDVMGMIKAQHLVHSDFSISRWRIEATTFIPVGGDRVDVSILIHLEKKNVFPPLSLRTSLE